MALSYRTRSCRNDYIPKDCVSETMFVTRLFHIVKRMNNHWREVVSKSSVSATELASLAKHIDKARGAIHELTFIRLDVPFQQIQRDVKDDIRYLDCVYRALTWYPSKTFNLEQ